MVEVATAAAWKEDFRLVSFRLSTFEDTHALEK